MKMKKEKELNQKTQDTKISVIVGKKQKINAHGIGFKLIMVVAIPILFIILLGVISYWITSVALTDNYETAALKTVESSGEYLSLGIKGVEGEIIKLITDEDFSTYYTGASADGKEEEETYKVLYKRYAKIVSSNEFVNSFNVISGYGKSYASNGDLTRQYEAYSASEEAKAFANGAKDTWTGYHNFIDKNANVSENSYALAFTKPFIKGEGFMIIDVKMNKVQEVLQKISFGEGCSTFFISGDKREISFENPHNLSFVSKEYYSEAVNGDQNSGIDYVDVEGKKQLFLYSKIGNTGAVICSFQRSQPLLQKKWVRPLTISLNW